uniref:Amino acid transporter transmembrane domain-containing protein n=1 Tax=Lotharella oceanica TaxID=641309 RepID=A0A7S2XH96_9EUKA|mmetsp:Transcript_34855/g.64530  ORF Transcript_34855/g.64530 Transcript_34855/m.64530 type:complete len:488 (+) Transcript_34855:315-1778(+)|eukprot:CAMPEP_0170186232 /NCGR_PEP_ID=MMETSP0040_2-20121228/38573_1 /TAXON_ID=641309 /ORGANISM="Lotharella oceanica, Strain CCMP622" /LENGTH=487 /DNA_ID=CAMNT_0010432899 /DNA_START=127 /DNA_END=1590 /DNA_ORIENTATION=+
MSRSLDAEEDAGLNAHPQANYNALDDYESSEGLGYNDDSKSTINGQGGGGVVGVGEGGNSAFQTGIILAKTISGTGNFALPFAFLNMGLVGGVVTIVGSALLTAWTLILMQEVKNSRYISERKLPNNTYVDIAYAGFGSMGAGFVYFVTLFCLEGVCSVYLNFVSTTLHSVYPEIDQQTYLIISVMFAVTITMINSMTLLKYMSGLGIISVTFTIICVMVYSGEHNDFLSSIWEYPMIKPQTYFRSFGSIAFFFCVNVNAMPIERSMSHPLKQWGPVVTITCLTLAIVNTLYGATVFMLLKDNTCGNVVLNLKETELITLLPKITMCIELVVSYPLILYAAVDIVERTIIGGSCSSSSSSKTKHDGLSSSSSPPPYVSRSRSILLSKKMMAKNMAIFVMACVPAVFAQIKSFAILVNLVGGFGASLSSYCFPPLLFLKVCGGQFNTSTTKIIGCVVLALVGFGMSAATTVYAGYAIVHPFPEPTFCR